MTAAPDIGLHVIGLGPNGIIRSVVNKDTDLPIRISQRQWDWLVDQFQAASAPPALGQLQRDEPRRRWALEMVLLHLSPGSAEYAVEAAERLEAYIAGEEPPE